MITKYSLFLRGLDLQNYSPSKNEKSNMKKNENMKKRQK
jgi:hypothetical protein